MLYLNRMGEYAQSLRPDRIILDYQMPWMNGKQLINFIRTADAVRGIPIVLLTGADVDALVRGNSGVDAIIRKPNTIEELIALMPKILGPVTGTTSRVQRTQRTHWPDIRNPDSRSGGST